MVIIIHIEIYTKIYSPLLIDVKGENENENERDIN